MSAFFTNKSLFGTAYHGDIATSSPWQAYRLPFCKDARSVDRLQGLAAEAKKRRNERRGRKVFLGLGARGGETDPPIPMSISGIGKSGRQSRPLLQGQRREGRPAREAGARDERAV